MAFNEKEIVVLSRLLRERIVTENGLMRSSWKNPSGQLIYWLSSVERKDFIIDKLIEDTGFKVFVDHFVKDISNIGKKSEHVDEQYKLLEKFLEDNDFIIDYSFSLREKQNCPLVVLVLLSYMEQKIDVCIGFTRDKAMCTPLPPYDRFCDIMRMYD